MLAAIFRHATRFTCYFSYATFDILSRLFSMLDYAIAVYDAAF